MYSTESKLSLKSFLGQNIKVLRRNFHFHIKYSFITYLVPFIIQTWWWIYLFYFHSSHSLYVVTYFIKHNHVSLIFKYTKQILFYFVFSFLLLLFIQNINFVFCPLRISTLCIHKHITMLRYAVNAAWFGLVWLWNGDT